LCFFAASVLVDHPEILEKFFELSAVVFGSDVCRSIFGSFFAQKYLRKFFVGDFDKNIIVVFSQEIVVGGLVFFDEIIF
jgi:hypothetical protein